MALANLYRVCQDLSGNVVPEVLGTVLLSGTSTLATLFSDQAGTAPLPNPLVNNPTYGSFSVFVGAGIYDMQFTKSGYTFETQYNIALRDPAAGVNVLSGTPNQVILTPPTGVGNVTLSLPQSIAPDSNVQFAHLGLGTPATGNALQVSGLAVFTAGLQASGAPILLDGQTVEINTTLHRVNINPTGGTNPGLDCVPQAYFRAQVGIQTPAAGNAALSLKHARASQWGLTIGASDGDSGGNPTVQFLNVAGGSTGSITNTATTTAYNTTSDGRLKTHIAALVGAGDVIRALRPVSFRWRSDDSPGVGFVAGEVAQVVDGVVTGKADAVDHQGHITPQHMDLSKLVPWLTAALQDALTAIETLTARVHALEA